MLQGSLYYNQICRRLSASVVSYLTYHQRQDALRDHFHFPCMVTYDSLGCNWNNDTFSFQFHTELAKVIHWITRLYLNAHYNRPLHFKQYLLTKTLTTALSNFVCKTVDCLDNLRTFLFVLHGIKLLVYHLFALIEQLHFQSKISYMVTVVHSYYTACILKSLTWYLLHRK